MLSLPGIVGAMTDTQTRPDPRPVLLAAAAQVTPLVASVTADDLDLPTPCDGWTVRDLLSHLLAVAERVPHVLGGGHPAEVPTQITGISDDAWSSAWTGRQAAFVAALEQPDVMGRTVHHPAGDMPAGQAIGIYVSELAVHAWDLAASLGDVSGLAPAIAEACLAPMQRALTPEMRDLDQVPFGRVVDVAPDASAYDRLVAWCGRDPQWTPAA